MINLKKRCHMRAYLWVLMFICHSATVWFVISDQRRMQDFWKGVHMHTGVCVCVCAGGGGGVFADYISFSLNIPWNWNNFHRIFENGDGKGVRARPFNPLWIRHRWLWHFLVIPFANFISNVQMTLKRTLLNSKPMETQCSFTIIRLICLIWFFMSHQQSFSDKKV